MFYVWGGDVGVTLLVEVCLVVVTVEKLTDNKSSHCSPAQPNTQHTRRENISGVKYFHTIIFIGDFLAYEWLVIAIAIRNLKGFKYTNFFYKLF